MSVSVQRASTSGAALAEDVAEGELDIDETLRLLTRQTGRALSEEEKAEIKAGMEKLVKDMRALSTLGTLDRKDEPQP